MKNSKTWPPLNSNLTGKRGCEKKIEEWGQNKNKRKTGGDGGGRLLLP